MKRNARNRLGITSVVAMLYMILFATLALGFYATVTTSVSLAKNDQKGAKALLATESGIQFMRYHLAQVRIPPGTAQANVFTELYNDLKANLEGTGNMGSNTVSMTNNTIKIPSQANTYIAIDNSSEQMGFSVSISEWGGNIVCKVIGQAGTTKSTKAASLEFTRQSLTTTAFDYAVASKGKVVMQKGSLTGITGISSNAIATVMSSKSSSPAVSVTGGTIGGDLNVIGSGLESVTGGSVGGTSNIPNILSQHVHVVGEPEFPIVDTSVFLPYATTTYTSGSTLKNIKIPPNTNPKFTGGATIQGILYIQSPNTVEFRGNVTLQGFIIFENTGTSSQNIIDMRGNFTHLPLPAGAEFDALRSTTGVAILAPTTAMTMSGSVDSAVKGNVILGSFVNGGSADMTIDQGTLMTLDTSGTSALFNGKTVKFKSTGSTNQPSAGMVYSQKYSPVSGSYQELNQ